MLLKEYRDRQKLCLQYLGNEQLQENAARVVLAGVKSNKTDDPAFRNALKLMGAGMDAFFLFREQVAEAGISRKPAEHLRTALCALPVLASPTTDPDAPEMLTRNFSSFMTGDPFDSGCFLAFQRTAFEPGKGYFEIRKGAGEVQFFKRQPTEPIQLSDYSAGKAEYGYDEYSGGVSWPKFIGERTSAGSLISAAADITRGAARINARVIYQLLCSSALINAIIPLATTGVTDLDNRIRTINNASRQIGNDLVNEVGVPPLSPLLLYVNADEDRVGDVQDALDYRPLGTAGTGEQRVRRSYTVVPTRSLRAADGSLLNPRYIVIAYPGRENQYADKRLPSQYAGEEWSSLIEGRVGTLAFGGGCNKPEQQRVVELWSA